MNQMPSLPNIHLMHPGIYSSMYHASFSHYSAYALFQAQQFLANPPQHYQMIQQHLSLSNSTTWKPNTKIVIWKTRSNLNNFAEHMTKNQTYNAPHLINNNHDKLLNNDHFSQQNMEKLCTLFYFIYNYHYKNFIK